MTREQRDAHEKAANDYATMARNTKHIDDTEDKDLLYEISMWHRSMVNKYDRENIE